MRRLHKNLAFPIGEEVVPPIPLCREPSLLGRVEPSFLNRVKRSFINRVRPPIPLSGDFFNNPSPVASIAHSFIAVDPQGGVMTKTGEWILKRAFAGMMTESI